VSGIHRMTSRNAPELTLPPAADDIEEGERVNAYWAVFCADRGWAGAFGCNASQACPSPGGARLVTPMPREIEDYETVCILVLLLLFSDQANSSVPGPLSL
jgi:hypothetical protein